MPPYQQAFVAFRFCLFLLLLSSVVLRNTFFSTSLLQYLSQPLRPFSNQMPNRYSSRPVGPSSNQLRRRPITRLPESSSNLSNSRIPDHVPRHDNYPDDGEVGLRQVITSLKTGGLASVRIIVGIDFQDTNDWTGKKSFDCKGLHAVGNAPNPYEQVISILEKALAPFTEGNMITCYGFGDETTQDANVFTFHNDHWPCQDFQEVLSCYKKILQNLRFGGRTSYAPVVDAAIHVVENSSDVYHILFIITDGQATRTKKTGDGELSPQEEQAIKSVVDASSYPLSIVLVGVGDGPWDNVQKFKEKIPTPCDDMKKFQGKIPIREFDNFQFVNFTEIMSVNATPSENETTFAVAALLQIPNQYKAARNLGMLQQRVTGKAKKIAPLPPPMPAVGQSSYSSSTEDIAEQMKCKICFDRKKSMAFSCGHVSCGECGEKIKNCFICRKQIIRRIRFNIDEITQLRPSVSAVGPSNSSVDEDSSSSKTNDPLLCPGCFKAEKDRIFECGHMTCHKCAETLQACLSCPGISRYFEFFPGW